MAHVPRFLSVIIISYHFIQINGTGYRRFRLAETIPILEWSTLNSTQRKEHTHTAQSYNVCLFILLKQINVSASGWLVLCVFDFMRIYTFAPFNRDIDGSKIVN